MFARGRSSTSTGARGRSDVSFDDECAPCSRRRSRVIRISWSRRRPRRQPVDASRGLAETILVDAGGERRADAVDGFLAEVVPHTQRIDPGPERPHSGRLDPDGLRHRLHLERIGHHDSVEPELVAQQPLHERRVDRRRQFVDADVSRHDRLNPGGNRGAERLEPVLHRTDEHRKLEVRVRRGRPVPGPVLRARGDPAALKPAHPRADMARNPLGVGAEGPRSDHGVRGPVDVGDGRQVPVHSDGGELGRDRCGDARRQLWIVDGAERCSAGVRAARLPLESGDVAALLVDREQKVGPLRSQLTAERREPGA